MADEHQVGGTGSATWATIDQRYTPASQGQTVPAREGKTAYTGHFDVYQSPVIWAVEPAALPHLLLPPIITLGREHTRWNIQLYRRLISFWCKRNFVGSKYRIIRTVRTMRGKISTGD